MYRLLDTSSPYGCTPELEFEIHVFLFVFVLPCVKYLSSLQHR